jgi:flavodoxin
MGGRVMKAIIVYYSRTGRSEKAAMAVKAALSSAGIDTELEKINPLKTKGHIKNAFMSLLRREVPILNVNLDVSMYDLIIIGGPVWAGSTAAPLNSYLEDIHGISGKKAAAFVTMAAFGGNRVLKQISKAIGSRGGKYIKGIELHSKDVDDEKMLDQKIGEFINYLTKKNAKK